MMSVRLRNRMAIAELRGGWSLSVAIHRILDGGLSPGGCRRPVDTGDLRTLLDTARTGLTQTSETNPGPSSLTNLDAPSVNQHRQIVAWHHARLSNGPTESHPTTCGDGSERVLWAGPGAGGRPD